MKKMLIGATTVAVVGLSSAFFGNSVHAETVDSLKDKQTEISDERSDVKADLSKAEKEIADVLLDLKEINKEFDLLDSALEDNKDKKIETDKKIKETEADIEVLEKKIEERYDVLKNRIASYQETGGDVALLDVFFGSKNFNEFISRVSAVTTITNSDAELMQEQEDDKAEVEEKLEEHKDMQADLEEMEYIIKEQKEKQKENKKELEEKEASLKDLKADLEEEDGNLAALEADIRRDIDAARNPAPEPAPESTTASSDSNTSNASSNSNGSTASSDSNGSTASSNSNNSNSDGNVTTLSDKKPKKEVSGGSVTTVGKQFIGNSSYGWGEANPNTGRFDCSGFVNWAYKQSGVNIPRTTSALANTGTAVSKSNMQPGDLVFFNTNGHNGHVGIYIGGGKFIGSQSSTGVAIESLNSGYWAGQFSGTVRRVN